LHVAFFDGENTFYSIVRTMFFFTIIVHFIIFEQKFVTDRFGLFYQNGEASVERTLQLNYFLKNYDVLPFQPIRGSTCKIPGIILPVIKQSPNFGSFLIDRFKLVED
jgi:hypothetical protein